MCDYAVLSVLRCYFIYSGARHQDDKLRSSFRDIVTCAVFNSGANQHQAEGGGNHL